MSKLTEAGFENIIKIAKNYGFKIDKEFIIENHDALGRDFAKADDAINLEAFPDEKPWWTFENEANSGDIDDTFARDKLLDNLALIILGMEFPTNASSTEDTIKFRELIDNYNFK